MTVVHLDAMAQEGYKAYGNSANWTNHAGNSMPTWDELPEPQRTAWMAAAEAIVRQAIRRPS